MADFRLTEVAKKAGLSTADAIKKLQNAGENITETSATISVEQMRILGVDPQLMLDKRKERLQQAMERRTRGVGKEIVPNSRNSGKEEAPQPVAARSNIMSKEELLKRKSELNKDIQKVDEVRQAVQKQKNEDTIENDAHIAPEAVAEVPVAEVIPEPKMEQVKTEQVEEPKKEVETIEKEPQVSKEEQMIKIEEPKIEEKPEKQEPAEKAEKPEQPKKPVSRPLGPAGYVPRENRPPRQNQDTRRPSATYQRPAGPAATQRPGGYQRPTGPAATQRPGSYQRPTGPASDRDRQQGRDGRPYDRNAPRDDRRTGGTNQPFSKLRSQTSTTSEPIIKEEERRWESKKTKEVDTTPQKEEAKKVKAKTEKPKDWSKTINEGLEELNIEQEIATEKPLAEVPPTPFVEKKHTPHRGGKKKQQHNAPAPTPRPTHVTIGEQVVVSEFAGLIGIKATELVKKLFGMGIMATVNQSIDAETAELLGLDYGVEVTKKVVTEEDFMPVYEDKPEDLERRPPVVTVMGHVDHGKTSLLDAIRSTSVAEKEAGGITQHIGAYEVDLNGRKITFLDTPGHEAFTTLRARGAQVTDIVILVVAANDGVMPQTKEAIDHAKAAGVRIVVAMNKIDRPDANPDRVRQQLAEYGIISDDWGGEYQFQEISAKKRIGIEDLLERVLLEADILELKGNPHRPAEGIIIESQLDKQKGPVATVLVKNGTLRKGDTFVVGSQMGKVRSMHNYRGTVVKEATISMPVEVMGFSFVPASGDNIIAVEDEKAARNIAEFRAANEKAEKHSSSGAISLSDFFNKVKEGEVKELNIIIKADVQGSLEALKGSLMKLSNPEVKVNIVHDATGGIRESDVVLAMASKAIIIGFNVRPDNNARSLADRENVSIELYSIIYKAIEDVKLALEGMLTPDTREQIIGKLDVRQVFSVPKLGKIAGCYVTEGKVVRSSHVRVIRDSVVIYDGKLASLKRFTDDVKEVAYGYECGLSIEKYQDIKEGDVLEVYELVQEKRTLDDIKSAE